MANALYPKFKESLLSQNPSVDLDTDTIKVSILNTGATYSSANQYYSSVSASALNTPQTLGSKTVTSGVFDAADVTFTAVTAGSTVVALVIYKDTGNAATSPLIAWIDTDSGGAISIPTNGGDISFQWDSGANKIFAL